MFLRPDEVKQKKEESSSKTEKKIKNQEEEIKSLRKELEEAKKNKNESTNRGENTKRGVSSNRGAEAVSTDTANSNRGEGVEIDPQNELTITVQQKTWIEYMNRTGNRDLTLQFKDEYLGDAHPHAGRLTLHQLQTWHAKTQC